MSSVCAYHLDAVLLDPYLLKPKSHSTIFRWRSHAVCLPCCSCTAPAPPSTNTPAHVTLPSRSNQSRLPQPIFNLYPHPVNPAKKGAFAGAMRAGEIILGRGRNSPPPGR
ncbi:hypothetical protein CEXT_70101 [Caerostris extrusa]|uniref:Uncharacterized protein n=1 Tax=Caerostris extrusa TaxID=172846 RepID=A0AAV4U6L0_CAEEX|nr:hypothetical protein CEXT_70101 [Caerostris extrusa]